MNISEELKKGLQYHQDQNLGRAWEIYAGILKIHPQHPDALHLQGLIAHQLGQNGQAIDLFNQAIQIAPDCPLYYNNLANAYKHEGNLNQALHCYTLALQLKPDYPEALFGVGNIFQALSKYRSAMEWYRRALDSKPDMHQACNNMGVALFESGNYKEASQYYQKALQLEPAYFEAYTNLGNVHKMLGKFEAANDCYATAIEIKPDCAEAYASMAHTFQNMGRLDDAVECYQKALQIKPDYAEAYNDLGTLYRELGQQQRALSCFKKSVELKPQNPEGFNNMGIVYKEWGRFEKAISCYQKAIKYRSDFADAHYNLGIAFARCGRSKRAIGCYKEAIKCKPNHAFAYNLLIRNLQQICDWHHLAEPVNKLKALSKVALENGEKASEMPFLTFSLSDDPAYNHKVAESWAAEISARASSIRRSHQNPATFPMIQRNQNNSIITIGYLSADFQNHATVHLMGSLFEYHDRSRFKIIAYSYGKNDHSDYRHKIEQHCDKFLDIRSLNDFQAAKAIHADEVDILVDLKGYTHGHRLEICAHRPAPIQVAWLGFPGTTGADFLDYIVTDKILSPPEHAAHFSEKFVYMPHTYQINDCHQKIARKEFSRQEFGLPQDGFVFCSFNEPYKIETVMFSLWMNVLQQVPSSTLWLIRKNRAAEAHLKTEAAGRGVAPERLVFADKLPKDEHLARYKLADLGLDTRLVNGHTTTSDALWAGIPVITLLGNHFASRVSASLLTAIGLPELVTRNLNEYQALAVRLASRPRELKAVKKKLAQNRTTMALFDTARFTRHLETAYRKMWQIYLQGEEPRQLEVSCVK